MYSYRIASISAEDVFSKPNVIVLIITRWHSFGIRWSIREMFKLGSTNLKFKYQPFFIFNYPDDIIKEDLGALMEENEEFKDMIMPNVLDDYNHVVLKLLSTFNFLKSFQSKELKWIVKIDDDLILNFTKFDEFFDDKELNNDLIYCPTKENDPVLRAGKW